MEPRQLKVLVIEDSPLAQQAITLVLEALHCHLTIADNAKMAYKLLANHQYNIIFMDLGLPDVDGLTITETILKMGGKNSGVPIVALTAYGDDYTKKNALASGVTEFLVKPLTLSVCEKLFARLGLVPQYEK